MLESSKQKLASSPCHSATPQLCFPSSQTNPQVSELNISNIMEFSPQKPQPTSPNETIKTYCRLRPCEKPISYSLSNQNKKLKITSQTSTHEYTFNKVFLSTSTNLDIFNEICKPLINDLFLKNKSTLLFTYGLSNSGKTHTIIGDLSNPGILPFSLVVIMDYILSYYNNKIEVKCVYVEIYNEKIYDLLSEKKNRLHLKECNKLFVLDSKTTIKHITSLNDFENALNAGVNRKVHLSTKLNSQSSRSHTIFKVMLSTGATFSIVDLAGAERSNKADTVGKGLKETCKINTSLMTLGRCIDAMEHNSKFNKVDKKIPVPIRESKLTKMFQEYFTGEHNVVMITNINPSKDDFLENRNVFAYACKAMKVKPICSWFNINNNINYSKSKTNNGYVSDISSDGNGDVGINEQLKNDYEVLLGKYESKVEENDDLEEKEKMLIEKIKLMEKDFIIRQHNEIIKRGNDFIKKMWSDFNSTSLSLNTCDNDNETNSNSNNNNDIEDNIIVLRNPLYKEDNNDKAQCENKNDKNVLECMFNVNNVEIFAEEKKEEEVVVNCFENTECFSIECSNNNIISNIVKDKKPTKKRKPYTKKEEKIINIKVNEDTIENEGSNNNSHNSDDNDEEDNVNKNKKKKAKTKKKNNKKQNEKQIIQNNNITTNYNNDSSNSDNEKEDIKKNKKGNNKKQKRKVKSKVKYKNSHDTINNSSDEDNNNNNSSNSDNEREEIKKNNKKGKAKVKQRKAKSKAKYNNDSSDNNSSDEDNNNNSSNTESKDSINEDDVQDYPVYKGTRKNKNESFMSDDDESKDSINDNSQSSSDNDDNDSDYKIHQKIKLNKNKKGVAHKNNNDGNVKNKKAKPKPCNKKAKNKKK